MGLDPVTLMAGSVLASGVIGAASAGSAADAQVSAAQESTQAQRDIFNQQVQLQEPFRQMGLGGAQKLSYLLGISPQAGGAPQSIAPRPEMMPAGGSGTVTPADGSASPYTPDQIRQMVDAGILRPQGAGQPFVNRTDGTTVPASLITQAVSGFSDSAVNPTQSFAPQAQTAAPAPVSMAPSAENDQAMGGAYGSLLRPFGAGDFQLDPGIQFQMQQGQQALQNSQSAKDGILGGAALKGLLDFNQRMAGTGYQSAFDRYMQNKQFTLGSLMDMTKLGQAAASNAAANGSGYASSIGQSIQGAGNAAAAGQIGTANAISGGLNGVGNAFMLRSLLGGGGATGGVGLGSGSPIIADSPIANFA